MLYTVGEMAKILGIPASTLRYYDKEGLLPFLERSGGGIRMFSEEDLGWLRIITCLKRSGLSIKEIRSFIRMAERGDDSLEERLELFRTRRETVQKQIDDLKETLAILEFKCWYYEQAVQDGTEARVSAMTIEELPEEHRQAKRDLAKNDGI